MTDIIVVEGDVADQKSDVMILKYADSLYGADEYISKIESFTLHLEEGETKAIRSLNTKSSTILFLGVGPLIDFEYEKIRSFARSGFTIASNLDKKAKTISMTSHGPGYGLDERESFLALVVGLREAFASGSSVERVIIVERNRSRAERFKHILEDYLSISRVGNSRRESPTDSRVIFSDLSISLPKRRGTVFLAMPFAADFDDEHSAIREACESLNILCERIDNVTFTGGILENIKDKIDKCDIFVAVLNGSNPNVFLELGYAWGRSKQTILISDDAKLLPFDVKSQNVTIYQSTFKLRDNIAKILDTVLVEVRK